MRKLMLTAAAFVFVAGSAAAQEAADPFDKLVASVEEIGGQICSQVDGMERNVCEMEFGSFSLRILMVKGQAHPALTAKPLTTEEAKAALLDIRDDVAEAIIYYAAEE